MEIDKPYIAQKSAFFGLFHYMVYTPTNSKLHHFECCYPPLLAGELKDLFSLDDEKFAARLTKCSKYEQSINGNLLVNGYVSADKQFVSLRLYQFSQIDYQPVSDIRYLQGESAFKAAQVFGL
ncbi:MAG: hypothetical protein IJS00_04550 [Paludibacteraceae bacterium]|nr:hypothetical protein [Paludibacteraceae bacterium]